MRLDLHGVEEVDKALAPMPEDERMAFLLRVEPLLKAKGDVEALRAIAAWRLSRQLDANLIRFTTG